MNTQQTNTSIENPKNILHFKFDISIITSIEF